MMRHTEMTAKTIRLLLVGILLAAPVGCTHRDEPEDLDESGREMMSRGNEQRREALVGHQFVQIRTVVVDIPIASGSESGIWDRVDDSGIPAFQRQALSDNGMRVAIGEKDDWPDLASYLEDLAGRKTEEVTSIAQPHEMFSIAVKASQPERTAFLIHPDGTLSGVDLPAGDYLLTMVGVPSPDEKGKLLLSCQPKVRSARRYSQVTDTPGGPVLDSHHRLISINLMTCGTTIQAGQFLLIGPSEQASRRSSVGHHLFTKETAGLPARTFYVLMPHVIEK